MNLGTPSPLSEEAGSAGVTCCCARLTSFSLFLLERRCARVSGPVLVSRNMISHNGHFAINGLPGKTAKCVIDLCKSLNHYCPACVF